MLKIKIVTILPVHKREPIRLFFTVDGQNLRTNLKNIKINIM
jgi:hypothetical protein